MQLSIIIPVYQVEQSLRRCVESLSPLPVDDYEVLLVDDCSPDGSGQLCDQLAQTDSHITAIHRQENGGLSAARNTGLQQAKGEYVTFVDSDDYVDRNTYPLLLQELRQHPEYDLLEYPVAVHEGAPDAHRLELSGRVYHSSRDYWYEEQAYAHCYAWNKICRRELFADGLRFPEGRVFEDVFMLPPLTQKARVIATTTQGLYHYMANPDGITRRAGGHELTDLLEAHLQYLRHYAAADDVGTTAFARYYAHVLNIQIDVYEATRQPVSLPPLSVRAVTPKLLLNKLIGTHTLCRLITLLHRLLQRR